MSESYYKYGCCQYPNCLTCAVSRGEVDPEMLGFLDIMLDGKTESNGVRVVARGYGVPDNLKRGKKSQ